MSKTEIGVSAFVFGFVAATILWISVCTVSMRTAAINAGVAEYTVDKTTGQVTFQYVKPNH